MASTPEMLRIIRHAADKLDALDPSLNASEVARLTVVNSTATAAINRGRAESVALAYASAVLRMVAACMDDEPDAEPKPGPKRGSNGRFTKAGEPS